MISRRAVLIASATAVATPLGPATAQTIAPPTAEAVTKLFEDRNLYARMLVAIDALRLLLILLLLEKKVVSKNPREDLAQFAKMRAPFGAPDFLKMLAEKTSTSERKSLIEAAGKLAIPTATKISGALAEGGVSPKGKIGMDLLSAFYEFSQLQAIADNKKVTSAKESWYCSIYPFSYFCSTG